MKTLFRCGLVGAACAALTFSIFLNHQSFAGGANKKLAGEIDAIAQAIAKGDKTAPAKMSKKVAKRLQEIYEPMLLFKLRRKKGIGVGKKGSINPDGIEKLVQTFGRDVPSSIKIKNNKDALVEMGYRMAAIADISVAVAEYGEYSGAKKSKANWLKMSKGMHSASMDFIKAVKSGSPQSVKAAASKLDNNCNACHSIFRD